jgi:hypothetical protein
MVYFSRVNNENIWIEIMRQYDKNNPLGLKIGDEVKVEAISRLEYSFSGEKEVNKAKLYNPVAMRVTGVLKKAIGYVKSEPVTLGIRPRNNFIATKYLTFYTCKSTIKDKDILVDPEDIRT